jgi:carbonic anhydrase
MERLIEGYKRFLTEVFPERKNYFHLLAEGQAPKYLFITCADSRVSPEMVFGIEPGNMAIARSLGSMVPPAGSENNGITATIEYAVEILGVRHAIIFCHSNCGSVRSALAPGGLKKLPYAQTWMEYVRTAANYRQPLDPNDGKNAELNALAKGNVLAQLANLRTQPSVAKALTEGRLNVHGWYYDIESGRVERYDEAQKRFVPLV